MTEVRIVRQGETAALAPVDPGFAHGYGVFETLRLTEGALCFWEAHWARLQRSAAAFGLPLDCGPDAALDAVGELARGAGLSDGIVKLSLLKTGEGAVLFVYARSATRPPGEVWLGWAPGAPLNPESPLAGHKTHSYMANAALLARAREDGFFDAVMRTPSGNLGETTLCNLFFARGGRWHTPSTDTGILPGVVRDAVLSCAEVAEGRYPAEALEEAEAVFLTNAGVGLLPVDGLAPRGEGGGVRALPGAGHPGFRELLGRFAEVERGSRVPL